MKNQLVYVLNSVTAKYTYMPATDFKNSIEIEVNVRDSPLLLGQNNFFNELFVLL